MRDPKRIPKLLTTIERVWQQYPDLRLCQLIDNALFAASSRPDSGSIFYTEDDLLLEAIEAYEKKMKVVMRQPKKGPPYAKKRKSR